MLFRLNSRDSRIFFSCILLSLFAFAVDLSLRWAIGGLVYILVILLSIQSSNKKYPYIFAALSTCLIIVSYVLAPPTGEMLRVLANRLLDVVIIWMIPVWFLHYNAKKELDSKIAAIVGSSEDAIWSITLEGLISGWNKSSQKMFGYTYDEIIGQSLKVLIPEKEHELLPEILKKIKDGERMKPYEAVRVRKDGSLIDVSISVSPIRDVAGNSVGGALIARDITERIKAEKKEKALRRGIQLEKTKLEQVLSLEEGLHNVLDLNKLIDFVVDKTTKILHVSKCSLMLVDETLKELVLRGYVGLDEDIVSKARLKIGDPIAGLVAFEGKPMLVKDIEKDGRFLRKNRPFYQSKSFISAPIKLGDQILGVLSVTDKQSSDNNIFTELDLKILCMIVRQIAMAMEASKLYRDLKFLTITDPLTGIYNFRYFTQTLDREINRAKRYERPLCIAMIDVDNFKIYNDTYGHIEGDILLQKLSRTFQENIRETDVACRYAGDEFIIILPDTDISDAETVAYKIRDKVSGLNLKMKVEISMGMAPLPLGKDVNRYDFMLKVDSALYEAKKRGKNRIFVDK